MRAAPKWERAEGTGGIEFGSSTFQKFQKFHVFRVELLELLERGTAPLVYVAPAGNAVAFRAGVRRANGV
jgi:hypothetical protein